jgi:hypothetical protein
MPEETLDKAEIPYSAPWWLAQITRYEKDFEQWMRAGDKLLKLYARQKETDGQRRFAMLYANTEVLKPSIYSRPPVPQVSRRFKDRDPIGRKAAELLERSSSYELERQNIDATLRSCRDDLVLPGRGTVWVRYEADIGEGEEIKAERVPVDYVNWRDFGHLPARVWAEVPAVWRAVYYDRSEAEREFDKEIAKKLSYTHKPRASGDDDKKETNARAKAKCYEIWCRTTRKQYIVSKEVDEFLRPEGPPPLDFEHFYPCPRPVYSLVTTDNLIPTPDYKHYQDQAQEIDDLTARIGKLTDSLKLVGFYPAGAGDTSTAIEKALDPGVENKLIPIESWATFAEHGGSNAIVWLPIKDVAETIRACVELRTQLIQDVYQISGISDILRGATDPNETASAQQLKSQWGSVRIKDRQQGMADFARDITRLVCEVIAERFEPQRVIQMANMELQPPPPPQPPMPGQQPQPDPAMQEYQAKLQEIEQAFALLKDEKLRGFRIDIETDSTIQPDEDAEKQRVNEFLTAVGGFMQQAFPLVQAAPELMPMMSEILLFTARRYRAGRTLEDAIEQSVEGLQNKMREAKANPPPNPEMEKVKMEAEAKKAEIAMKQESHQQEMAFERQKDQDKLAMEREKNAQAVQANQQKIAMQGQMQQQQMQMDDGLARDQMANEAAMQEQQESKEDKAVIQILSQLSQQMQAMQQQLSAITGQAA